jgi:hypothetical protein
LNAVFTLLDVGIYASNEWPTAKFTAPPVIILGITMTLLAVLGLCGTMSGNPEESKIPINFHQFGSICIYFRTIFTHFHSFFCLVGEQCTPHLFLLDALFDDRVFAHGIVHFCL